ncbi:molybdenum cofactor sulfurase [Anaeramoeba flamelloides]|uniref:Molybdenum cofactor sulfurase n=1 Tax=Anaeramoeba flamelloides TaxID=1746091 RepID=A0AAV7Y8W0_9EUKA|nr:molybdenum cofactor sulfurase [Anaeramoeba flamelloides]
MNKKKEKRTPKPNWILYLLPLVIVIPLIFTEITEYKKQTNIVVDDTVSIAEEFEKAQVTNEEEEEEEKKKPWLFQKEKRKEYHSPELKEKFLNKYKDDYGYDGEIDNLVTEELSRLEECYLDYTGAALYAKTVLEKSFHDLSNNVYGNAHSRSPAAIRTETSLAQLRRLILNCLNADKNEYSVIFTSGTTQSVKMVGESFPWSKKSKFLYLKRSHNSVVGIREYAKLFGNGFYSVSEEEILEKNPEHWKEILGMQEENTIVEKKGKNNKKEEEQEQEEQEEDETIHLLAYPAESNFDGSKFDLDWIHEFKKNPPVNGTNWMVLLDAAAYLPTNSLDLKKHPADFVACSLYKMFGYPTGLGVLITRNEAILKFKKHYWGGGTIILVSDESDFCLKHPKLSTKFEDGTLPFLDIITAKYGFEFIHKLQQKRISRHVYSLAKFLYDQLIALRWKNGKNVVEVYGKWKQENNGDVQGGIVTFNTLNPAGEFIGYNQLDGTYAREGIQIRSGCHCNPGSCSRYFGLNDHDRLSLVNSKTGCGDDIYQVNHKWLGASRISLGYLSTFEDVEYFLYVFKNKIMTQFEE